MVENVIQVEMESRKILLEVIKRAFPEAEVEGIPIPQMNKPDGWEIAIRLKNPDSRSIILRPQTPPMINKNINLLQIFLEGIQTAKLFLSNPPLKEQDFQGTILLNDKGVERFLEGEKADSIYL